MISQNLRCIAFKDHGYWIAQILEYDIGAQAHDFNTLVDNIMSTLDLEVKESMGRVGIPFGMLKPAPKFFHDTWLNNDRDIIVISQKCHEIMISLSIKKIHDIY